MRETSCAVCAAAFVLCCASLVWIGVRLSSWLARERMLRSIPMPNSHWLFGHLDTLKRPDHHLVMRRWADELGGMFRMRLGPIQVLQRKSDCTPKSRYCE